MRQIKSIRGILLGTAIAGFLFINIPFLYFAVLEREVYTEAMRNGMALVFMGEAFLLMFLIAFLISRLGLQKPGWLLFIVFSVLGSLAFSIPFFLYLHSREGKGEPVAGGDATR